MYFGEDSLDVGNAGAKKCCDLLLGFKDLVDLSDGKEVSISEVLKETLPRGLHEVEFALEEFRNFDGMHHFEFLVYCQSFLNLLLRSTYMNLLRYSLHLKALPWRRN